MIRIPLLLAALTTCINAQGAPLPPLDIYGGDSAIEKKIQRCCQVDINRYNELTKAFQTRRLTDPLPLKQQQDLILQKIKAQGQFARVKLSTVFYSDKNDPFTTIDLVKQSESWRLPESRLANHAHLRPREDELFDAELKKHRDLFNQYINSNIKRFISHQLDIKSKGPCPAFHCIFGFTKDEIKTYYIPVNRWVDQHHSALSLALAQLEDNQMRADIILLIGNASDPRWASKTLLPYITDRSASVRNNSMRVLGAILEHHSIKEIPLDTIIKVIDYPYVTDRNKASVILMNIAEKDPATHQKIIDHAGLTLIKLLKLRQPDNHDFAWRILKIISKKKFGEHDIQGWNNWILTHQTRVLR